MADTKKMWIGSRKNDYKNARVGNKYIIGFTLQEPTRHIVSSRTKQTTKEVVVGETTVALPTGEIVQVSSFNEKLVGTPAQIGNESTFKMKVYSTK